MELLFEGHGLERVGSQCYVLKLGSLLMNKHTEGKSGYVSSDGTYSVSSDPLYERKDYSRFPSLISSASGYCLHVVMTCHSFFSDRWYLSLSNTGLLVGMGVVS